MEASPQTLADRASGPVTSETPMRSPARALELRRSGAAVAMAGEHTPPPGAIER